MLEYPAVRPRDRSVLSLELIQDLQLRRNCLRLRFDQPHLDRIANLPDSRENLPRPRDRMPRATVEKRSIRPLADALLAPDAQDWIHLDTPEGPMILIWDPVHAVGHRTIRHARRRSRAPRAALGDNCQLLRLLLPGR